MAATVTVAAQEEHVDVAVALCVEVVPEGAIAELEVLGRDPLARKLPDRPAAEMEHCSGERRELDVLLEGGTIGRPVTDKDGPVEELPVGKLPAERDVLVWRHDQVHAFRGRCREAGSADRRLDPQPRQLVAERFDDLDEEEVLVLRHHEDELEHGDIVGMSQLVR
mgnify:CR=1 FL=1